MSKPRVYLAGPAVFLPDPFAAGARMKAVCAAHGLEGVFPMDLEARDEGRGLPHAIRKVCLDLLETCDAVLADMTPFRGPSMDGGTAFEMGWADHRGLPVVGYSADPRPYLEKLAALSPDPLVACSATGRVFAADDMEVENFGERDNLMMACTPLAVEATFEAAAARLAAALAARGGARTRVTIALDPDRGACPRAAARLAAELGVGLEELASRALADFLARSAD